MMWMCSWFTSSFVSLHTSCLNLCHRTDTVPRKVNFAATFRNVAIFSSDLLDLHDVRRMFNSKNCSGAGKVHDRINWEYSDISLCVGLNAPLMVIVSIRSITNLVCVQFCALFIATVKSGLSLRGTAFCSQTGHVRFSNGALIRKVKFKPC